MGVAQFIGSFIINTILGVVGFIGSWTLLALFLQCREALRPDEYPRTSEKRIQDSLALSRAWRDHLEGRAEELQQRPKPLRPSASESSAGIVSAVDKLLAFVLRDFVHSWYASISNDAAFVDHVHTQLLCAVDQLFHLAGATSIQPLIVENLAPALIAHIIEFRKAEQVVKGAAEDRVFTESQEFHELVASKYAQGRIHSCLHLKGPTVNSELAHLRSISERVLPILLPDSKDLQSPVTRTFLREIIASAILKPVIDSLSDPHFWNQNIDHLAGATMRELCVVHRPSSFSAGARLTLKRRNILSKVRQVLQRQSEAVYQVPSVRSHEEFLKMIKNCKSLIEAKKLRNQIIMEVRRSRLEIIDRAPDETVNGVKVSEIARFINKLLFAKTKVEKRIEALGGPPYVPRNITVGLSNHHVTLTQLLSSTVGLSYFMEYLDHTKHTNLLQLWLMADGFRQHILSRQSAQSLCQDFEQIYQTFFAPNSQKFIKLPLHLSLQLSQLAGDVEGNPTAVASAADMTKTPSIQSLATDPLTSPTLSSVVPTRGNQSEALSFQPVLDAQLYVFQQMEAQDFVQFAKSDLYLSLINDTAFLGERDSRQEHEQQNEGDDNYTLDLALINEEALLPSDAVEAVEEELRSILDGHATEMSTTMDNPSSRNHSRGNSTSSAFSRISTASKPYNPPVSTKGMLRQHLDRLSQQEAIVDSLLASARKENKNRDLMNILEKSKLTLRDEIRELLWQEIQEDRRESTVLVSGKWTVNVISNTVGTDGNKEFALYVIEVKNPDLLSAGWIVTRRYSEFLALHHLLKAKFPFVAQYDLPKKAPNAIMGNVMRKSLVEGRQEKLGKYLQVLTSHQEVCDSEEFRRFICQENLQVSDLKLQEQNLATRSVSLMKHLQRRIIDGLDVFAPNPMPDNGSWSPSHSPKFAATFGLDDGNDLKPIGDLGSQESINRPREDKASDVFCELFIETFDLKEKTNWLRRQAVLIILQQILGETIDRKLTESIETLSSPRMIEYYIEAVCDLLWPNGTWPTDWVPPADKDKEQIKSSAKQNITTLIPGTIVLARHDNREVLGGFVGRDNARKGALRIFSLLQNQVLNRHLLYTVLDMLVDIVFNPKCT